jgi:PPE-repeat protein
VLDFGGLPPEVNSGRMYSGPGSGSLMAAGSAWDGLAAELGSTAAGYTSVISELTSSPWVGPASRAMVAAATPYISWLSGAATLAEQAGSQARSAAAAYETAFGLTVPPPVIAANRVLLMTLVATNFFGQNTAAIAATEAQYAEMWAQDATAMYGYAGSSAIASALDPFTEPAQTTDNSGLAAQAAAVSQAEAEPAGTGVSAASTATPNLVTAASIPSLLQELSSSVSAISLNPSQWWIVQALDSTWGTISASGRQAIFRTFPGLAYFGTGMMSFFGSINQQLATGLGTTAGAGGAWFPTPQFASLGAGGWHAPAMSGHLASATRIGNLSVPASWTSSIPGSAEQQAVKLASFNAVAGAENGEANGLLRGIPMTGGGVGRRASEAGYTHKYGFRHSVTTRPPSAG